MTSAHGPTMSFAYKDAKGDELLSEIDPRGSDQKRPNGITSKAAKGSSRSGPIHFYP